MKIQEVAGQAAEDIYEYSYTFLKRSVSEFLVI